MHKTHHAKPLELHENVSLTSTSPTPAQIFHRANNQNWNSFNEERDSSFHDENLGQSKKAGISVLVRGRFAL